MAVAGVFCNAAEMKVVTEYIYPTEYTVTPITATDSRGNTVIVGGIVQPGGFQTREVGVSLSVAVEVGWLSGTQGYSVLESEDSSTTELMLAATAGDLKAVQKCLARGDPVNVRNRAGSTALMGAAAGGFVRIASLLLQNGADPNSASLAGFTALMFAARNGHDGVADLLLRSGADPEMCDNEGRTALFYAAEKGHVSVARRLVEAGANPGRKDNSGRTPVMVAEKNGRRDMVILLQPSSR